ncbi:MAG: OsmC family protein [Candidatus Aminicenantes bacterium]|nr:OsmC family protein [Candidatus Aminicenantes bacterium]
MADQLLSTQVTWTEKLHFQGQAEHEQVVAINHAPPLGDGNGIKPMELLLMSLASCSAQTVISLLKKMRQDVRGFTVKAEGARRVEHPTVFTEIRLSFEVEGNDLSAETVDKAIRKSEEKYCPVWAMLKPGVKISYSYKIQPA